VTSARQALGAAGEEAAAAWYRANGYEIVARNWRCKDGELDLVARRGRTYVFCEVKTRTTAAFGAPIEAVGRVKQQRLRRLAAIWLRSAAPGPAAGIRFDVASILGSAAVEVTEGAF